MPKEKPRVRWEPPIHTEITPFQKSCLEWLNELTDTEGLPKFTITQGVDVNNEPHFQIETAPWKAWIYVDGAQISGEHTERRFEAADYRSREELMDKFVNEWKSYVLVQLL